MHLASVHVSVFTVGCNSDPALLVSVTLWSLEIYASVLDTEILFSMWCLSGMWAWLQHHSSSTALWARRYRPSRSQSRRYQLWHCSLQSFRKRQAFHMRVNKSPSSFFFHFHTCQAEAIAFNLCIKATEKNKHSLMLFFCLSSPVHCSFIDNSWFTFSFFISSLERECRGHVEDFQVVIGGSWKTVSKQLCGFTFSHPNHSDLFLPLGSWNSVFK